MCFECILIPGNVTPLSGYVCFECILIPGKATPGCYIKYSSTESEFSGNVTIRNKTKDCRYIDIGSDVDGADNDIECENAELITRNYRVTGYDIDDNGTVFITDRPATETFANITGRNCTTPTPPTTATGSTPQTTTETPTNKNNETSTVQGQYNYIKFYYFYSIQFITVFPMLNLSA